MSKLDDLIEQSLSDEDRDLLDRYGSEPGYLRQVKTLFGGSLGWVMWLVMSFALASFIVAMYALWQVFTTADTLLAVRWGVVAVILMQVTTFLRGFMGSHLQANRTLREIKRLELRMIHSSTDT